jgi:hypothetical protein
LSNLESFENIIGNKNLWILFGNMHGNKQKENCLKEINRAKGKNKGGEEALIYECL